MGGNLYFPDRNIIVFHVRDAHLMLREMYISCMNTYCLLILLPYSFTFTAKGLFRF